MKAFLRRLGLFRQKGTTSDSPMQTDHNVVDNNYNHVGPEGECGLKGPDDSGLEGPARPANRDVRGHLLPKARHGFTKPKAPARPQVRRTRSDYRRQQDDNMMMHVTAMNAANIPTSSHRGHSDHCSTSHHTHHTPSDSYDGGSNDGGGGGGSCD